MHGLPLLPDDISRRKRQAEILWPFQPGRRHAQPCGRGLLFKRQRGGVLENHGRTAGFVLPGAHVPPQPAAGHAKRRRADSLAGWRPGPFEKRRNDRQAALWRLLDDFARLRRSLRVRDVYDRPSAHRRAGHVLRSGNHAVFERRLRQVESPDEHRLLAVWNADGIDDV